jgi:Glyoxalase-like domain
MDHPRLQLTALDCPDPVALGRFYELLTGGELEPLGDMKPEEVSWIELDSGNGILAFQKIGDFRTPTWPGGEFPQQLHLDFTVSDLDESETFVLSIGATKAAFQPGETFRIYLDPVGHPFCLVQRS